MRVNELISFLQKVSNTFGDVEVNVYLADYRDVYERREHHVSVLRAEALHKLSTKDDDVAEVSLFAELS